MQTALGVLALALLGADGPPKPDAPEVKVAYQLHVYEMKGVGWREDVYHQLQPVKHEGNVSIWTADRATARAVGALALATTQAPRLTAAAGVPSHVVLHDSPPGVCHFQDYLLGTKRLDESVIMAGQPTKDSPTTPEHPKFSATFTGRRLDQGVLTKLVIEETRFLAVHRVSLDDDNEVLSVPEVAKSDLIGEWLIPRDGALVISLGAHTVADADGQAVVRERLVVLEAQPVSDSHVQTATFSRPGPARGLVAPALDLAFPTAPSRSLPQTRLADGTAIDLPPLPTDDGLTPTALPNSSEPCASPQTRPAPGRKTTDAGVNQTSREAPRGQSDTIILRFNLGSLSLPSALFEGLKLPSGRYMEDDVKYFSPAPEAPPAP